MIDHKPLSCCRHLVYLFLVSGLLALNLASHGRIVYVKPVPSGDSSGTSWANAADLSVALKNALPGDSVWVLAGTYLPAFDKNGVIPSDEREKTFYLKNGVSIWGGFNGSETSLLQRNWAGNVSILSGNIGATNNSQDNCYHIVLSIGSDPDHTTAVDGFTLSGGFAHYSYVQNEHINNRGGAICLINSNSSVRNNRIDSNYASQQGAALYIYDNDTSQGRNFSSEIINCVFSNNRAEGNGGALCLLFTRLYAEKNVFKNNFGGFGGGAYCFAMLNSVIRNNIFTYNESPNGGGLMCSGYGTHDIYNNVFANNTSSSTGGLVALAIGTYRIFNNTIINNQGGYAGGLQLGDLGNIKYVSNNIFWGNTRSGNAEMTRSDVHGSAIFKNNILQLQPSQYTGGSFGGGLSPGSQNNYFQTDPLLDDPTNLSGPDGIFYTGDDGLHPASFSPCIDMGDSSAIVGQYDITGTNRIKLNHIDIGAYEYGCINPDSMPSPSITISVNTAAVCNTYPVVFKASFEKGGIAPLLIWRKNRAVIHVDDSVYSSFAGTDFSDNDTITCFLKSSRGCLLADTVESNKLVMQVNPSASRFYVNKNAAGLNNGTSWTNAFTDLHSALAYNGCVTDTLEIWVAAGEYKPSADPFNNSSPANPKDKTFYISRNTRIYGGFAGNETSLSQRSIAQNPAILSGNIGNINDSADNSCHVILVSGSTTARTRVLLDGLVIANGLGGGGGSILINGNSILRNSGGGISAHRAELEIRHCIFTRNHAIQSGAGGALTTMLSKSTVSHTFFLDNTAMANGGAIYSQQDSFTINSSVFARNRSASGGALFMTMSLNRTVSNTTFYDNSCMLNGVGGAVSTNGSSGIFSNNIFWNNKRGTNPLLSSADYYATNSNNTFTHNMLQFPSGVYTPAGNYGIGASAKNNLFGIYPEFQDTNNLSGADGYFFTNDDGLSLQHTSLCIDMGDSPALANGPTDIAGNPRLLLNAVDMGPYEFACAAGDSISGPQLSLEVVSSHPVCERERILFRTTARYQGNQPAFTWMKNGSLITDSVSPVFSGIAGSGLAHGDTLTAILTSNRGCIQNQTDTASMVISVIPIISRLYVNTNATGANNGMSWSDAFTSLHDALRHQGCLDTLVEVWVAAGTYIPSMDHLGNSSPSNPRDKTFYIPDRVKLYGGFAGNEVSLSQRNIINHETILSGDLGIPDNNTDNAYHVVISAPAAPAYGITIDGFTITGGRANLASGALIGSTNVARSAGAGLFIANGTNTISNNKITGNSATGAGGGLYTFNNNNLISGNIISHNSSSDGGGGYLNNGTQLWRNNFIFSNTAGAGAGMMIQGGTDTAYQNIIFSNISTGNGGALTLTNGTHLLANNILFKNSYTGSVAYPSAGLHTTGGSARVVNTIFYRNSIPAGSTYTISDYRAQNSANTVERCMLQHPYYYYRFDPQYYNLGASPHSNLYHADPMFSDTSNLAGADSLYGTPDDGLALTALSPAIDAGDTTVSISANDITGSARIKLNGIDIGAYEYTCDSGSVSAALSITVGSGNLPSCDSASVTFKAIATYPGNNPVFQWTKNGTDLPGETSDSLTLTASVNFIDGDLIGCRFKSSRGCLVNDSATATPLLLRIHGPRIYVNQAATGNNNGSSWADAYTSLQDALKASCRNTEIWVAAGIYKPSAHPLDTSLPVNRNSAGMRDYTFHLTNGMRLYGGFAGTETSLAHRTGTAVTTLSGDIGVPGDSTDNCYHVVLVSGNDSLGIVIDGFTIERGYASGLLLPVLGGELIDRRKGAGIYIQNRNGVLISNNVITRNSSSGEGGGVYIARSTATLNANIIQYNSSVVLGGGLCVSSLPCTVDITNNIFFRNMASNHGGGFYLGAGNNRVINNTICFNSGTLSGGVALNSTGLFYNNIFWANKKGTSASVQGSDYFKIGGTALFKNNLLQLPTGSYTLNNNNSYGIGAAAANNVFGRIPLFKDTLSLAGADGIPFNEDDGFSLERHSWGVNNGDSALLEGLATDIKGAARTEGSNTDIGAYERDCGTGLRVSRLYVKANATGSNTGLSWTDAFTDLNSALQYGCLDSSLEIWVAAGTYIPSHDVYGNAAPSDPRTKTFFITDGVHLYGGFAGNETSLDQRNISQHVTTLGGDIGVAGYADDNCYHVAVATGRNSQHSTLNGFYVRDGRAQGSGSSNVYNHSVVNNIGAGLYIAEMKMNIDSCTFLHNESNASGGAIRAVSAMLEVDAGTFLSNKASDQGGAVSILTSEMKIRNSLFARNHSSSTGGAVSAGIQCKLQVYNSIFDSNQAPGSQGGALHASSGVTLNGNSFLNNVATHGGAVCISSPDTSWIENNLFGRNSSAYGAALHVTSGAPRIRNNFVISNSSSLGGALYLSFTNSTLINNVISANTTQGNGAGVYTLSGNNSLLSNTIHANRSALDGGGIYISAGINLFSHNIFWDNRKANSAGIAGSDYATASTLPNSNAFRYNLMQLDPSMYTGGTNRIGSAAGNIHGTYPLFADSGSLAGPDNLYGTSDDGLRLQSSSVCIDTGQVSLAGLPVPENDVTGRPRVMFGRMDIGAYEFACQPGDSVITPSVTVSILKGGNPICDSNEVIFHAAPNYTGATHKYQWMRNGAPLPGETQQAYRTLANTGFFHNDSISCMITSMRGCLSADSSVSMPIKMTVPPTVARLYVKADATGQNNGSGWADALTDLQSALNRDHCKAANTEIWVAAGSYRPSVAHNGDPSPSDPRDKTFVLDDGLKLYGGFNGTETFLDQRNPGQHPTILSGDIGMLNDSTDNCYHILVAAAPAGGKGITIDGFTFTGGQADGSSFFTLNTKDIYRANGGGLYIDNHGRNHIANNIFTSNYAIVGGGFYLRSVNLSTSFRKNLCTLNRATHGGGAYFSHFPNGTGTVDSNTFSGNVAAQEGGGLHSSSGTDTLQNNIFHANSSGSYGGGIYKHDGVVYIKANTITSNYSERGGGIYAGFPATPGRGCNILGNTIMNNLANSGGGAEIRAGFNGITNNLFVKNQAVLGGGINFGSGGTSHIAHNTFAENIGTADGGAVSSTYPSTIKNNIFWQNVKNGNTRIYGADLQGYDMTVSHNMLQLPYGSYNMFNSTLVANIYDEYPLFSDTMNVAGPDNIHRTADDGYMIRPGSPAFNTGDTVTLLTDITGASRLVYAKVDMGAYEFDSSTVLPVKLVGFTAQRYQGTDRITWTTSSEQNIDSYEVQQSDDGTRFRPVGIILSRNSSMLARYGFSTPALSAPFTYYRLKINEADGTHAYSQVAVITETKDPLLMLHVYPNPARDYVIVDAGGLDLREIRLYDASGRSLGVAVEQNRVNMENLGSGIYLLEVRTSQGTRFFKLLKE